ncbi:MAG: VWA domain-containing protein, partial [Myxococcales bacterium]|nr:VWA domain-containing protein [Myxococcales bacterium]
MPTFPPARARLRASARRRLAAVGVAVGALVGACFSGEALLGEPCLEDAGCGPALACVDGFCGGTPETFSCGDGLEVSIVNIRPNVVLIVDRSGSMSDAAPGADGASRWEVLRGLVAAIVERFDLEMNLGLVFFPAADASPNQVERACNAALQPAVEVAPTAGAAILTALPIEGEEGDGFKPAGAAPIASALEVARDHL